MDFPQWQLHRGYWQEGVRENTLMAFEEAHRLNCKMVELDVQMNRNGDFFVLHDFNLKRFFFIDKKLRRMTSEEISGIGIPRLESVLESDQVPSALNIEIKSHSVWVYGLVKKLVHLITPFANEKQLMVSSFNPLVIFWFKTLMPELPRALLVGKKTVLKSRRFRFYMNLLNPHYVNVHYSLIDDPETWERLQSFAKPLMVWTVNEYSKAQFYLARGVKSVISDFPPKSN